METSIAPGDAVDDDDRRFAANLAGRILSPGFHASSISHLVRDGKVSRASCARRSRSV